MSPKFAVAPARKIVAVPPSAMLKMAPGLTTTPLMALPDTETAPPVAIVVPVADPAGKHVEDAARLYDCAVVLAVDLYEALVADDRSRCAGARGHLQVAEACNVRGDDGAARVNVQGATAADNRAGHRPTGVDLQVLVDD